MSKDNKKPIKMQMKMSITVDKQNGTKPKKYTLA